MLAAMSNESTTAADAQTVAILLDRIAEVCPIPAAAQRVMMIAGAVDADIGDVAEALAGDPALAAEAMRIANSAVFRRGRPVDTLGHAVLTLGLSQIHQMASAMALMAAFRSEHELSTRFHRSSVLAGSLAGLLANEVGGVDCGVAFVAGLLSEVGAMACVAVDGEAYSALLQHADGDWDRRGQLEREHFTITSWEIGARLLSRNALPESITSAVGADYATPVEALSVLARVTMFGRMVAPEIIDVPYDFELSVLKERFEQVAQRCHVVNVPATRLVAVCHGALSAAEHTMVPI
jgi:HD-like signal output (HDOD) protein